MAPAPSASAAPTNHPPKTPLLYPQIIEDEVFYNTIAPWPVTATPGTQSLNRTGLTSYGSDATSWTAATATPGQPAPGFEAWATANNVTGGPGRRFRFG